MAYVLRTQRNAWIHLLAALLVVAVGLRVGLAPLEWAVLALAVSVVLAAEMANTAMEALADALCPDHNPLIGTAKDVAAGAVLVSASGAVVVGLLLLGPRLLSLLA